MWNNTCEQHPSQWGWELSGRLIFERHIWPDLHRAWKHECARHQCVNERHFVCADTSHPSIDGGSQRQAWGEGPQVCGFALLAGTGIMEWPGLGCSELFCTYFIHGPHHSLVWENGIAQEWQMWLGEGQSSWSPFWVSRTSPCFPIYLHDFIAFIYSILEDCLCSKVNHKKCQLLQ